MADIVIKIPDDEFSLIQQSDSTWAANAASKECMLHAIKNGIVLPKTIPDNPTNGDMIKALFPGAKIDTNVYTYVIEVKLPYHTKHDTGLLFDKDWWNAPYTGLNKPDPDVGRMM